MRDATQPSCNMSASRTDLTNLTAARVGQVAVALTVSLIERLGSARPVGTGRRNGGGVCATFGTPRSV